MMKLMRTFILVLIIAAEKVIAGQYTGPGAGRALFQIKSGKARFFMNGGANTECLGTTALQGIHGIAGLAVSDNGWPWAT
ncbi:MAG: hypothetical protein PHO37_00115 [Kiritimatiellae bacterium]|nr:hypothetical protein [Kiritimatiellia bacterium]